ncbi:MAG: protein kinase [Anaerolineae bacterium]|nr:protein kinase [Anaerolineae bacterium]
MPYMVDHRYLVGEQLGVGGMGAVYRGKDTRLQRDVAIKRLQIFGSQADVDQFMKRFEREAIAMAQLQHPNIVGVLDFGQDDQGIFLILQYMPGGSLKDRMTAPFNPQSAAALLAPIADALHYVHDQGMIHRDVKPGNILFDARGNPMLADFGIVKLVEDTPGATLTGTGTAIGTPTYMAPELIGGEFDHRVDQYALGIIFYEMVTGKAPFTGRTPMEAMVAHKYEPLPDPRLLCPGLPQDAWDLIVRVLAKDPEQRYEDSGQFSAALRRLGQPPTPTPQPQPKPGEEPTSLVEDELPFNLPAKTPQPPAPGMQAVSEEDETQGVITPGKGTPVPPPPFVGNETPGGAPLSAPSLVRDEALKPPAKKKRAWVWVLGGLGVLLFLGVALVLLITMLTKGIMEPAATQVAQTHLETKVPTITSRPQPTVTPTLPSQIDNNTASALQVKTRIGKGNANIALYSPDGSLLVIGNSSGFYLLGADTGKELSSVQDIYVTSLAIAPSGNALATLDQDGYLTLWDIQNKFAPAILQQYPAAAPGASLRAATFSPDGNSLAYADYDTIFFYSFESGTVTGQVEWTDSNISQLQFNPDGQSIYGAANQLGLIGLWDMNTLSLTTTFPVGFVFNFALAPDGSLLAVYDSNEGTLKFFKPANASQFMEPIQTNGYVSDLAFSADGASLYGAINGNTISRWILVDDRSQLTYPLNNDQAYLFDLAPDGSSLAWTGFGAVGVFDFDTEQAKFDTDQFDYTGVLVEGWVNGEVLYVNDDHNGSVILRNTSGIAKQHLDSTAITTWLDSVTVSSNGQYLAARSYVNGAIVLLVWDLNTKQLLKQVPLADWVGDFRFSDDSQFLTVVNGMTATVYRTDTWGIHYGYTVTDAALTIAKYYPEFDLLVLAGYGRPLLINPLSGYTVELPLNVPAEGVFDLELSRDGSLLFLVSGKSLLIWNIPDQTFVLEAYDLLPNNAVELALNTSETLLAIGDNIGNIVFLDLTTNIILGVLRQHFASIRWLTFSVDDHELISFGDDGITNIWGIQ